MLSGLQTVLKKVFAMYTVIAAWSTDPIQADFAILTAIAAWSTDNIQAGFVVLTMIIYVPYSRGLLMPTVTAAWSSVNI